MRYPLGRLLFGLAGVIAFVALAIALESNFGVPFDTSLRVACSVISLGLIISLAKDYPGELWPWVSLFICSMVNTALFFTPLVDRPASRGELMLFLLPDSAVVLGARLATYSVTNDEQRATRQYLVLGLVGVLLLGAALFGVILHAMAGAPQL